IADSSQDTEVSDVDDCERPSARMMANDEPVGAQPQAEPGSVELTPAMREIDAHRVAFLSIECVHERMRASRVERVRPAVVLRTRAREWSTLHDALSGALVDHGLGYQSPSAKVIGANAVSHGVLLGDVLDQVEHPGVRGERVEGEVAAQLDDALQPEPANIDEREGACPLERRTTGDIAEHERAPVTREPVGRSIEGDLWDAKVSLDEGPADDSTAISSDCLEHRLLTGWDRDIADITARNAVPTLQNSRPRASVTEGSRGRHRRGNGSDRGNCQ